MSLHIWMLIYLLGSIAGSSCSSTIAGFPSEKECEKARVEMVAKLAIEKSACIEVTQMIGGAPPHDHEHDE